MEKETLTIIKPTKYGFKTDEGLVYATKEVKDYLKDKLPCEVKIIETKPYGKTGKQISKVIIGTQNSTPFHIDSLGAKSKSDRPKIDAGNTLSLAVQIYISQKDLPISLIPHFKDLHSICEDLITEFKYLENELK